MAGSTASAAEVMATASVTGKRGTERELRRVGNAMGPTGVCGRKKAAAAENEETGAGTGGPANEFARGGSSATTGTTPEGSGEPGKATRADTAGEEAVVAETGRFWPESASPGKRVNEFIVLLSTGKATDNFT